MMPRTTEMPTVVRASELGLKKLLSTRVTASIGVKESIKTSLISIHMEKLKQMQDLKDCPQFSESLHQLFVEGNE